MMRRNTASGGNPNSQGLGNESGVFSDPGGTNTGAANPHTSFGLWVAIRVRPFNKRELQDSDRDGVGTAPQSVVDLERDHKTLTLLDPTKGYAERANFHFDYVFSAFRPIIELEG